MCFSAGGVGLHLQLACIFPREKRLDLRFSLSGVCLNIKFSCILRVHKLANLFASLRRISFYLNLNCLVSPPTLEETIHGIHHTSKAFTDFNFREDGYFRVGGFCFLRNLFTCLSACIGFWLCSNINIYICVFSTRCSFLCGCRAFGRISLSSNIDICICIFCSRCRFLGCLLPCRWISFSTNIYVSVHIIGFFSRLLSSLFATAFFVFASDWNFNVINFGGCRRCFIQRAYKRAIVDF